MTIGKKAKGRKPCPDPLKNSKWNKVLLGLFPKPTVSVLIGATRGWLKEKGSWTEETNVFTADSPKHFFPTFLRPKTCYAAEVTAESTQLLPGCTLQVRFCITKVYWDATTWVQWPDRDVAIFVTAVTWFCLATPTWERCQIRSLLIWPWACETAGKAIPWLLVCQRVRQASRAAAGVPAVHGRNGEFPTAGRGMWPCMGSTWHQHSWQRTSHHLCNCYWIGGFFLFPCNLKIRFQCSKSFTPNVCFQGGHLKRGQGIKTLHPLAAAQQPSKVTSKGSPHAPDLPCPVITF